MAIGDTEQAFMDAMTAHHQAGIALAENYLKKSDTATRPPVMTRMAANAIQDQTYQIENISQMQSDLVDNPRSADRAAAIILGRESY